MHYISPPRQYHIDPWLARQYKGLSAKEHVVHVKHSFGKGNPWFTTNLFAPFAVDQNGPVATQHWRYTDFSKSVGNSPTVAIRKGGPAGLSIQRWGRAGRESIGTKRYKVLELLSQIRWAGSWSCDEKVAQAKDRMAARCTD